jgi:predicted amidophosphoribosyltransferase
MDPLFIYVGAVIVLLGILIAAAMMQIRPQRPCPTCGTRVDLDKRRCNTCGYDFSPVRLSR